MVSIEGDLAEHVACLCGLDKPIAPLMFIGE